MILNSFIQKIVQNHTIQVATFFARYNSLACHRTALLDNRFSQFSLLQWLHFGIPHLPQVIFIQFVVQKHVRTALWENKNKICYDIVWISKGIFPRNNFVMLYFSLLFPFNKSKRVDYHKIEQKLERYNLLTMLPYKCTSRCQG